MATLDAFEPDIAVQIAGCPSPLIERAVLNAAIDFCRRTHAWQTAQDFAAVEAADFPYLVTPPTDAELYRVLSVMVAGVALKPVFIDALDASGEWRTDEGNSTQWLMEDRASLLVYPLPTEPVDLQVRASFMPTRTATSVPDFLEVEHLETIQAGAMSRLLLMPKRDWTDAKLGMVYAAKFADDAEYYKSAMSRSLSRSVLRVKAQFI